MSTKTTIYKRVSDSGEIHIFYESGINTPEEGVYLYAFKSGSGDVLIKLDEPEAIADAIARHLDI